MQPFMFTATGAPSVIRSDEQMLVYVAALLELDERTHLTEAEDNFAELLSLLIEAYVQLYRSPRSGSSNSYGDSPTKRDVWRQ